LLHHARGYFTLPVIAVAFVVALASLVHQFDHAVRNTPKVRESRSFETLDRAKTALIAFAAENANRPGGLPCPDRDGDGEAELACDRPEHRVGFLPWQTLRTGDLRDASGNRLWYAVSQHFRNDPDVAINSHSRGDLALHATTRGDAAAPDAEKFAAVIIGPGPALAGQRRSTTLADRGAWLEGRNAGRDLTAFESRDVDDDFNDAVVALSAAELFDVVDRVVANRIRNEIAPLIRARVMDRWGSLPYAVPFSSPLVSEFVDIDEGTGLRGHLPAANGEDWVQWRRTTIQVEEIPSATGTVRSANCDRSTRDEVRCDVEYEGAARIRVSAIADNVGRALVDAPDPDADDFGPANLIGRRIAAGPIATDASARIEASATLPPMSKRIRVTLRAPAPIRELTDENVPVATAHSWFARNRWHEVVYYAISPAVAPGTRIDSVGFAGRDPGASTAEPHFLIVDRRNDVSQAEAVLVFHGRRLTSAAKSAPDSPAAWLEGSNAAPDTLQFTERVAGQTFNDTVIALCSTRECKR